MTFETEKVIALAKKVFGENPDGIFTSRAYEYGHINREEEGLYSSSDPDYHEVFTDINCTKEIVEESDEIKYNDRKYFVYRGATKIVIFPTDEDYVIKASVNGIYVPKEKGKFVLDRLANRDAIKEEIEIFTNATDEFKEVLLPNIYVGNVGKIDIYIQEKYDKEVCENYYFEKYDEMIESGNEIFLEAIEYFDEDYMIDATWLERLIEVYGAATMKIIKGIANWPLEKDLHDSNYGYDKDNNPKIWDYAGYTDWEWWE